jgi:hypothetical protein
MKRFAYLSFGLLCLMLAVAVGYHIGSNTARAHETPIAEIAFFDERHALEVNGEVWLLQLAGENCWLKQDWIDPPRSCGRHCTLDHVQLNNIPRRQLGA